MFTLSVEDEDDNCGSDEQLDSIEGDMNEEEFIDTFEIKEEDSCDNNMDEEDGSLNVEEIKEETNSDEDDGIVIVKMNVEENEEDVDNKICYDNSEINQNTEAEPFKCDLCEYRCSKRAYLFRHSKLHTEDKLYRCEICDKGFMLWLSLKQHLIDVHNPVENKRKCECGKVLSSEQYLSHHKKSSNCPLSDSYQG